MNETTKIRIPENTESAPKKTLKEDLSGSLDKMSRAWIRKPITIFLYITLVLPISILFGIVIGILETVQESYYEFLKECWEGNE